MSQPAPLLNLTTSQLQYLISISGGTTLADAADDLQISPSALSQGLTELERRVGLELFERQGRNRVLSRQGQEAVIHAERILNAIRDMTVWAGAAAKGDVGQVRLGLIDIAAVNYFPETLMAFRADRPQIELHLTVAPSATLVSRLMDGSLDAAVIVEPPTAVPDSDRPDRNGPDSAQPNGERPVEPALLGDGEVTVMELLTEELAIYAPSQPSGRSTGKRVGPPATWGPWVTFPRESHTRKHVARALRELGADFQVEAESNQPDVLRQMVNLGMGWTVLPVLQAETEPNPLVRARRKPLLTRRLVIAQRRGSAADEATAELIRRLQIRAGAPLTA